MAINPTTVTVSDGLVKVKAAAGRVMGNLAADLPVGMPLSLTYSATPTKLLSTAYIRATAKGKIDGKNATANSNSVHMPPTGDGSTQLLVYVGPDDGKAGPCINETVIADFFASSEPVTFTVDGDLGSAFVVLVPGAKGVRTLYFTGLPTGNYTVTMVGQWSKTVGTVSFSLT